MRIRGMVAWRRDSLGYSVRSRNDGLAGCVYHSNNTGEGVRTLKGAVALVTIKQRVRQA